jgi:hypothetical protein
VKAAFTSIWLRDAEVRDAAHPLESIGYRALGDKADLTEAYSISQRPTIWIQFCEELTREGSKIARKTHKEMRTVHLAPVYAYFSAMLLDRHRRVPVSNTTAIPQYTGISWILTERPYSSCPTSVLSLSRGRRAL